MDDLAGLKELLQMMVTPDMKRKLELHNLTNDELFKRYDETVLAFRQRSGAGLRETRRFLGHFRAYLGQWPPSEALALSYLGQYQDKKPTTFARYVAVIKSFMAWYGSELDIKVRIPQTVPDYVNPGDIDKLIETMTARHSHKKKAAQDVLLVTLAVHSGLRRAELAALKVGDINLEIRELKVRQGKGQKDRLVPIAASMVERLHAFIEGRDKSESLFGLKATSIGQKVHKWARKAGVDIHTHSLRVSFATSIDERGASQAVLQELMGHSNPSNTKRYIRLRDDRKRDAINSLDDDQAAPPESPESLEWIPGLTPLPVVPIDLRRNKNAMPPGTDRPKPDK